MVDQGPVETQDVSVSGLADTMTASSEITANTSSGMDLSRTATGPLGRVGGFCGRPVHE